MDAGNSATDLSFLSHFAMEPSLIDTAWIVGFHKHPEASVCLALCKAMATDEALMDSVAKQKMGPKQRTHLMAAANKGDVERVKLWIKRRSDVNATDRNAWTPMHYAAFWGHDAVVRVLVENGAIVNAMGVVGPLHVAVRSTHTTEAIVRTLVEVGTNVNTKDHEGNTALHIAAMFGYVWIVRILIELGADPNTTNNYGHTPLRDAANGVSVPHMWWLAVPEEVVQLLVPLAGHEAIARILIEMGARAEIEREDRDMVAEQEEDI